MISYGYAAGSIQTQQWGLMWDFTGHVPLVQGGSDWLVQTATGTRTVAVIGGTGAAKGILDIEGANTLIALPAVTGVDKFATIVCRRDWTLRLTSFLYVGQSTTNVVSPLLATTPGNVYDQPLAIVRTTATSTVPIIEQDLRVTLRQAQAGWGDWVPIGKPNTVLDDAAHGHTWAYRLSIPAGRVEIRGAVTASDGTFSATTTAPIGTPLPVAARPNRPQYYIGNSSYNSADLTYAARFSIDDTGQISYFNPSQPAWLNFDGWVFDLS